MPSKRKGAKVIASANKPPEFKSKLPKRDHLSTLFPPKRKGKLLNTTMRLPESLLKELDAIAEEAGYTRTEVFIRSLEFAVAEHRRQQQDPDALIKGPIHK